MMLDTRVGLSTAIAERGYAFVEGYEMRELLTALQPLSDWKPFAGSWDDRGSDRYMADGGRYRRRRHAVYAATADGRITRGPHQPHFQSRDYNPLNGGIARWFDPIDEGLGSGPTMRAILAFTRALFEGIAGRATWPPPPPPFRPS